MNDQIKQRINDLAVQAGIKQVPVQLNVVRDSNGVPTASWDYPLEKFTKSIVKECIEQGKLLQSQTIVNGSEEYTAGREMGIEVFINQIKKQFGVE